MAAGLVRGILHPFPARTPAATRCHEPPKTMGSASFSCYVPVHMPSRYRSSTAVSCWTSQPSNDGNRSNNPMKILLRSATVGALSFSIFIGGSVSSPCFAATDTVLNPTEICREEGVDRTVEEEKVGVVTNEDLVEEAWEVVNDSFFDAGKSDWTPEKWLQKREDILSARIPSRSKAHDVIRRMLAGLHDPYTRFLSSEEFSKMAKYDITGIGVNLREVPDASGDIKIKVLGILLDGPAHSAGVRQGDELLSVNGVDVKGKSAFEVSSLLQGPTDTSVTIEVRHGSCMPSQSIDVQRKLVARSPVFYRLEKVENGKTSVGYIHLKEFNALARKDLLIAMQRLQESGATYFVLDLRDNLGGLVQSGIEVAKLFLEKGDTVIYTAGRDAQIENRTFAENKPQFTAPLIVLVNNRTASASEIVAAALHDQCKAVLVGSQTYGKGLIQSVFELRDGSGVVVTIGKYVTPNRLDINRNGIEPDFPQIPALSEIQHHLQQCKLHKEG